MPHLLTNCCVVGCEASAPCNILIGDDGRIASRSLCSASAVAPSITTTTTTTDCTGLLVSPGFIDIQFNGAFGVDFSDGVLTLSRLESVLARLPQFGVTSVCVTLISSSVAAYRQAVPLVAGLATSHGAANFSSSSRVIGLHLEGPFLHRDKKGAHAPQHLRNPPGTGMVETGPTAITGASIADFYGIDAAGLEGGLLRIVTLAPELEGGMAATRALSSAGVVVAVGHSTATYDCAREAVEGGGATLVTHMFNAMTPFSHREPGIPGLLGYRRRAAEEAVRETNAPVVKPAVVAAAAAAAVATTTTLSADGRAAMPFFARRPALSSVGAPFFSLIADGVHLHPAAAGGLNEEDGGRECTA